MGIGKYRYYFTKPKSEIVKDIFSWLLIGGVVAIAATSPYFVPSLMRGYSRWKKYHPQKLSNTFSRLRREGFISIERKNRQLYIFLTPEGKRKAGMFQINDLKIKKPRKWDAKWRLLMFDIEERKRIFREALRGKLKELGFLPFQKSVWIHPFDCNPEIELLQEFFGLSKREMQLVVAEHIGEDGAWKEVFKLST
ncbi:MAG: hypothetical protein HYS52_01235 [Candidatus Wildermuthbacteria bacterium]|nr:hypothetical protein [Candidatus Wildermuthbacteria bacterium]